LRKKHEVIRMMLVWLFLERFRTPDSYLVFHEAAAQKRREFYEYFCIG